MEGIYMEYREVIGMINDIDLEEFTIDSFKKAGEVYQIINSTYGSSLLNKKMDAKTNYLNVLAIFNAVVYEKLKEKLQFDSEIIEEIVSLAPFFSYILDIYIIDGNVIVKLKNRYAQEESYLVSKGFYDIASKDFTRELNYDLYKGFFTDAMNKAMAPIFKEKWEKGSLLHVSDSKIGYNLDDLNIYVNKSLKELMQINTDVTKEVAKVLIKHDNDEIFYYDLKIHYAYLELAQNDYKVNKLSEMLKEKEKVKTKKH